MGKNVSIIALALLAPVLALSSAPKGGTYYVKAGYENLGIEDASDQNGPSIGVEWLYIFKDGSKLGAYIEGGIPSPTSDVTVGEANAGLILGYQWKSGVAADLRYGIGIIDDRYEGTPFGASISYHFGTRGRWMVQGRYLIHNDFRRYGSNKYPEVDARSWSASLGYKIN
jgi:hypothetical protein